MTRPRRGTAADRGGGRHAGASARRPHRPRAFLCADPGHRARARHRRASAVRGSRPRRSRRDGDLPTGRRPVVGYHRDDDGARAGGGRLPAALPRSPTLVGAPRARRGRGRGLAGGADRGARHAGRPPAGRGGRAPPRRRQDPAAPTIRARAPPRRRLGGVADRGRPSRAGARGRGPPGHPPGRRRCATGAGRRSRRARSGSSPTPTSAPAQRLEPMDARFASWRSPPPGRRGRDGRTTSRAGARRSPRGGRLSRGRRRARRRSAAWPGPGAAAARPPGRTRPMTTTPLAFFWGDDELSAARALDRFQATLAAESGAPLERWLVRGDRNAAAGDRRGAPRAGRDAGHVRWRDAGRRRQRGRARRPERGPRRVPRGARGSSRRATRWSSSTPASRAPRARPRSAWPMRSPRPAARSASSSRRARARWPAGSRPRRASAGCSSRRAPPRRWPSGSAGSSARPTPSGGQQTRIASMELDKLALYRGTEPITPDDVRGARRRGGPGLGLGVHRRGRPSGASTGRSAGSIGCSRPRRSRSSWPSSIGASAS